MRSYYRTLRTALRALRQHRMRSALTCLGIVIGIAAVIAMIEVGKGTSAALQWTIANLGANLIQIDPAATAVGGVSSGDGTALTLVPEDCEAVLRECSAVRTAAPGVDFRMQVLYGNRNWNPKNILGTAPAYLTIRNWGLQEGVPITDDDVLRGAAVCLMGQTVARHLFGNESPVGKEVLVHGVTLKVVGLLRRKGTNMMGRDQDDYMIAPWTTVKFRLYGAKQAFTDLAAQNNAASALNSVNTLNRVYPGQQLPLYSQQSVTQAADTPQLMRFTDIDDIYVSATSPEAIPKAIAQIREVLRRRHKLHEGQPDDFNVRDWTEMAEVLGSTTTRMTDLLLCVALISLVVGGVGIMNIMLVSVTERTREIGLRMAVGARAGDILRQFLAEAAVLCLFGGVGGILLGRGVSYLVTKLMHWPTVPSMAAVLVAVAVSVTIGIVFGYYPAWKASRLDPIEALRYE
jgi:ABC-type antimicrobial peptide transport system permease subunit